jgi:hypothetical protein
MELGTIHREADATPFPGRDEGDDELVLRQK